MSDQEPVDAGSASPSTVANETAPTGVAASGEAGPHELGTVASPVSGQEPAEPVVPPLVETLDPEALRLALDGLAASTAPAGEAPVPTTSDLPPRELRGVLEALLLVANRPLSSERLAALLPGTDACYLEGFLTGLAERYQHEGRGWDLKGIAGGWQLLTRAEFHPWVRQLERKELPTSLGRSALETLAIIAYKQPVSRGQIEDIRGVQSGPMIRQLMDLKLVQVLGRSEELLGKPLLYGTTDRFLDRFGVRSPAELPRRHELA